MVASANPPWNDCATSPRNLSTLAQVFAQAGGVCWRLHMTSIESVPRLQIRGSTETLNEMPTLPQIGAGFVPVTSTDNRFCLLPTLPTAVKRVGPGVTVTVESDLAAAATILLRSAAS